MNKPIEDKVLAVCERSGAIVYTDEHTRNGLPIAFGNRENVERILIATARHSKTDSALIVPGVPEASSEDEAFDAVVDWTKWIEGCHQGEGVDFGLEAITSLVAYKETQQ